MCSSTQPWEKRELGVLIKSAECHKVIVASLASHIKLGICFVVLSGVDITCWFCLLKQAMMSPKQVSKRGRTHLSYTGILISDKEEERFSSLFSCLIPCVLPMPFQENKCLCETVLSLWKSLLPPDFQKTMAEAVGFKHAFIYTSWTFSSEYANLFRNVTNVHGIDGFVLVYDVS